jgi:hypothetical protein
VKLGTEWLDLLHKLIRELLASHDRNSRDIVYWLLGIKLRTLTTWAIENIDNVTLNVEQSKLEHGEEPDWPRTDNDNIGLNDVY